MLVQRWLCCEDGIAILLVVFEVDCGAMVMVAVSLGLVWLVERPKGERRAPQTAGISCGFGVSRRGGGDGRAILQHGPIRRRGGDGELEALGISLSRLQFNRRRTG